MKRFAIVLIILNLILLVGCQRNDNINPNNGFEISNGTLIRYTGQDHFVTIPDEVTDIGPKAFLNCNHLYSLTIPKTIMSVCGDSFEGCYHLIEIFNQSPIGISKFIPNLKYDNQAENSLVSINNAGFVSYKNGNLNYLIDYIGDLSEIIISNNYYRVDDYAFYQNEQIKKVIIADKVVEIGPYAFALMPNLESVGFGSGIRRIADYAFFNDYLLTSVKLSTDLLGLSSLSFAGCNRIVELYNVYGFSSFISYFPNVLLVHNNIDEKSHVYKIGDYTVLKDNDKIYLINVPANKTQLNVPEGITDIRPFAFDDVNRVCRLVLPHSLKSFDNQVLNVLKHLIVLENASSVNIPFVNLYSGIDIVETNDGVFGLYENERILIISLKNSEYLTASNVSIVYQNAYADSSSLYLVLYLDVREINANAFNYSKIKEVYYIGSREEYRFTLNKDVYYYSDVALPGYYWHFVGSKVEKWNIE